MDEKVSQEKVVPPDSKFSAVPHVVAWLRDLILSLIIAGIVILFIYQPVQVEGNSMEPTLIDRERIFINKFTYRFGIENIERGDMVVFWFPGDPKKSYIKRISRAAGRRIGSWKAIGPSSRIVTETGFCTAKGTSGPVTPATRGETTRSNFA